MKPEQIRKGASLPSSKILQHLPALCNQIRRVAIEAGEVTLDYFDESGFKGADAKSDGSPVTLADERAELVITKALKEITPDVVIVGEEAAAQGYRPVTENLEYFWLVDPLDGTKEFISGSGDYTVNIGLIHKHEPVLGVVYAPVHGEMYAACGSGTAIKWMEDSGKEKPIRVREAPAEGLTIVSSKSHGSGEKLDRFLSHYKINKQIKRGSSLKICAIAAGKADMYPRFGPTCEWDTAAAHAVLKSAGGFLTDEKGNELTYGGRDPKFLNPEFIARSAAVDLPEAE
jgi:3'(2'), 5'-bisphosphate nucleotidase